MSQGLAIREQAFEVLRHASQHLHIKLRDLAATVADNGKSPVSQTESGPPPTRSARAEPTLRARPVITTAIAPAANTSMIANTINTAAAIAFTIAPPGTRRSEA
jgi:hypothetical protein